MKRVIFVLLLGMLAPMADLRQARATLGERADSVAKDRRALSAKNKATVSHTGYTVQELALDGTTVREYLNVSGIVFAIAWKGMAPPDMDVVLGSYADEYRAAKKQTARKHGRKQSKVEAERVVVETWGHMRNLQGRAYLPALIPKGVSVDEIH